MSEDRIVTGYLVSVAGWDYMCWADQTGKVVQTACKGRWNRTSMPIGDPWLATALQRAVDEARANELAHKAD